MRASHGTGFHLLECSITTAASIHPIPLAFASTCRTYLSRFCGKCGGDICCASEFYPTAAALPDRGAQAPDLWRPAARTFLWLPLFALHLDDQLARFRAVSRTEPASEPNFFRPPHGTTPHVCGVRQLGYGPSHMPLRAPPG